MRTSLSVVFVLSLLACSRGESKESNLQPAQPPTHEEHPAGGPPPESDQPPGVPGAATATPEKLEKVDPKDMPALPVPPDQRPDASGPDAQRAIFSDYGFPGYPNLEQVCGQRVYQPGGMHLTWDAFSSNDSPDKLVAHYKQRLGENNFVAEGKGGSWKLPNPQNPQRVLTINALADGGPWKSCDKQPPKGARTILTISRR